MSALRGDVARALERHAADGQQAKLLSLALLEFDRRAAQSTPFAIAHELPTLIDGAITGAPGRRDIACITAMLEMGMDLLDHVGDNELGAHWSQVPLGAVVLAATGLVGCLPHLEIASLDLGAELRAELHALLAAGLPAIGAGQQRDFAVRTPMAAIAALAKTGARYALYARLASRRAEAPNTQAWVEFASALGAARQLASDCQELVSDDNRDLAAGVTTWPMAWARERAPERIDALAQEAREFPEAAPQLRRALLETGVLRRAAVEVELRCQRALAALERAEARGEAAEALRDLAVAPSFGRRDPA